jgi:hypothetical protein
MRVVHSLEGRNDACIQTRRKHRSRCGGPARPRCIPWCGRTGRGASHWCSASRRATSRGWTRTRVVRCSSTSWSARPFRERVPPPLVGRRHRHVGQPRRPPPRHSLHGGLSARDAAHHDPG